MAERLGNVLYYFFLLLAIGWSLFCGFNGLLFSGTENFSIAMIGFVPLYLMGWALHYILAGGK